MARKLKANQKSVVNKWNELTGRGKLDRMVDMFDADKPTIRELLIAGGVNLPGHKPGKARANSADTPTDSAPRIVRPRKARKAGTPAPANSDAWTCTCGRENTRRFCGACKAERPAESAAPAESAEWICPECNVPNSAEDVCCGDCGADAPSDDLHAVEFTGAEMIGTAVNYTSKAGNDHVRVSCRHESGKRIGDLYLPRAMFGTLPEESEVRIMIEC